MVVDPHVDPGVRRVRHGGGLSYRLRRLFDKGYVRVMKFTFDPAIVAGSCTLEWTGYIYRRIHLRRAPDYNVHSQPLLTQSAFELLTFPTVADD